MHFVILTLFPEMFPGSLGHSLAGKALSNGIWKYSIVDIKDFGNGPHRQVDDYPYGGGTGMVMRPDVLASAIDYAKEKYKTEKIFYPSPRGKLFNQKKAIEVSELESVIIICGRFEGIDERILWLYNIEEISVGDYVLSGGEVAALVIMDSCIRIIKGVLKNEETIKNESFCESFYDFSSGANSGGVMLEYPLYTRPFEFRGLEVPEVLISGNHASIEKWKKSESLRVTMENRPELLKN
jgi:tRNA (guanine37-N1)-methyltransferase